MGVKSNIGDIGGNWLTNGGSRYETLGRTGIQPRNQIVAHASQKYVAGGNVNLGLTNGSTFNGGLLDRKDVKKRNFGSSIGFEINN